MEEVTYTLREDPTPTIKHYEGFGELVTGSSEPLRVIITGICMLNDPRLNQYYLDSNLRLKDRITGTVIFPREGMALPDGKFYVAPAKKETE